MLKKPKQEESDREFHIGDAVKVKLNDGKMVDAKIRALVANGDELQLHVDYGHEETALIKPIQVITWELLARFTKGPG